MKLYGTNWSPYAIRVMIQIAAKGLDFEVTLPPGGWPATDEYKAQNPIGKIPALQVGDTIIPESTVIMDYLESEFPEPALQPADPLALARMRLLVRMTDLYLGTQMSPIFQNMMGRGSQQAAEEAASKAMETLAWMDHYADGAPYLIGDRLSLADCTLGPILYFVGVLMPNVGQPDPLAGYTKLAKAWDTIRADAHAGPILKVMHTAFSQLTEEMSGGGGAGASEPA